MNLVALLEEQLGEVRAVLTGDTCPTTTGCAVSSRDGKKGADRVAVGSRPLLVEAVGDCESDVPVKSATLRLKYSSGDNLVPAARAYPSLMCIDSPPLVWPC